MRIAKSKYKMITLGFIVAFVSFQILLSDQGLVSHFTSQAGYVITAKENWKEFNSSEVTYVQQGWYENVTKTFKKTSVTGKGPLWAQVAASVAYTKNESGEPMCGFKMKI